ncbi:MAG: hypothetical protein AB7P20_19685 [Rhizobiaceae bacterium]
MIADALTGSGDSTASPVAGSFISIVCTKSYQRVPHVDDRIQPGAEQVLLSRLVVLAWPGHRVRLDSRIGAQWNRQIELRENSGQTPQILQCRIHNLPQSESHINGLPIVHGRVVTLGFFSIMALETSELDRRTRLGAEVSSVRTPRHLSPAPESAGHTLSG